MRLNVPFIVHTLVWFFRWVHVFVIVMFDAFTNSLMLSRLFDNTVTYCFMKCWTVVSKKHFRPDGMARSESTRSVRAVRDTPVAVYSAPGVHTMRHVASRPPIAVSPFLLALSVSDVKQTLWRCCQLWPYIGMGSLGTHLHRDCNAMGDAVKISPRVPSTFSSRSVGRRWQDMILAGREDPRNCVDPRKERVRPKVGKDRVWIFIVW